MPEKIILRLVLYRVLEKQTLIAFMIIKSVLGLSVSDNAPRVGTSVERLNGT